MHAIAALDPTWFHREAEHQARLTMPAGALGRLLDLGQQLCAIQQTLRPEADPAAILLMAADHGIAAEGVSAYPQEVTGQMVANFLRGGAAINVLAHRQKARVLVVDMGMRTTVSDEWRKHPDFIAGLAIAPATANFLHGLAMSEEQVTRALTAGRRVVAEHLAPTGVRVVGLGEMGIGNTTSASALTAALTAREAAAVTGRGTGLDNDRWRHKVDVIDLAVRRHFPDRRQIADPLAALAALGGFEIAALVGAALEAASLRMLIVLDGFISSVAGLLAVPPRP